MWRIAMTLAGLGFATAGCATLPQPVNRPCGVITDPLGAVHATTKTGERRITAHFERGVRAGCWSRSDAAK
jgi:hypothetical protein